MGAIQPLVALQVQDVLLVTHEKVHGKVFPRIRKFYSDFNTVCLLCLSGCLLLM